jgi:hypothetical protein
MSIKKLLLCAHVGFVGLCVLFAGCSTGRYSGEGLLSLNGSETTTDKGVSYLLGRGVPHDDTKAFYYFNRAANDDDPFAQNEVAYLYAAGKGTPRDYGKALFWYTKAANHGLASAQYNLGLLYVHGLGTPPNKALAIEWFQKSAAHGFEPARQALTQYRS